MKCKFGDSTPLSKAASRIQVRHLVTEAAKEGLAVGGTRKRRCQKWFVERRNQLC